MRLIFPFVVAACLTACGPLRCDTLLDCPDIYGYQCNEEHRCVSAFCDSDAECDVGEVCERDRCATAPTPCVSDADCPSSVICFGHPWPACTSSVRHCSEERVCR